MANGKISGMPDAVAVADNDLAEMSQSGTTTKSWKMSYLKTYLYASPTFTGTTTTGALHAGNTTITGSLNVNDGTANGGIITVGTNADGVFSANNSTGVLTINGAAFTLNIGGALNAPFRLFQATVASLPSASTYPLGIMIASDTTGTAKGTTAVGGGSTPSLVYSNGTNWIIL